jgi:Proton-conducting membrane transporter
VVGTSVCDLPYPAYVRVGGDSDIVSLSSLHNMLVNEIGANSLDRAVYLNPVRPEVGAGGESGVTFERSSQPNGIGGGGGYVLKNIFLLSSLLSLILGTVVGLAQIRIKRLLAYSTISHVGFLLLALAINTEQSTESLILYLIQYTITSLNTFFILLAFGYIINSTYHPDPHPLPNGSRGFSQAIRKPSRAYSLTIKSPMLFLKNPENSVPEYTLGEKKAVSRRLPLSLKGRDLLSLNDPLSKPLPLALSHLSLRSRGENPLLRIPRVSAPRMFDSDNNRELTLGPSTLMRFSEARNKGAKEIEGRGTQDVHKATHPLLTKLPAGREGRKLSRFELALLSAFLNQMPIGVTGQHSAPSGPKGLRGGPEMPPLSQPFQPSGCGNALRISDSSVNRIRENGKDQGREFRIRALRDASQGWREKESESSSKSITNSYSPLVRPSGFGNALRISDSSDHRIRKYGIYFDRKIAGALIGGELNKRAVGSEIKNTQAHKSRVAERGNSDISFILDLKGQFVSNPILSLSLAICLFSMAGIPPLMGFFGKLSVLYAAIGNGYFFMALVAIIVSVISAYYYLRIIRELHAVLPSSAISKLNLVKFLRLDLHPSPQPKGFLADAYKGLSSIFNLLKKRPLSALRPCDYQNQAAGWYLELNKAAELLRERGRIMARLIRRSTADCDALWDSALGPATRTNQARPLFPNGPERGVGGAQFQFNLILTNIHSFIIATLTMSILLFVLKPSIILNSTVLLSLSLFNG